MKINLKKFRELEKQKLLSCQKHEAIDLLVWNYTPKAKRHKKWIPEVKIARGLITDLKGNIKYRPFEKFFSWEDHLNKRFSLKDVPDEPYKVFNKLDGSLGILYWIKDEPFIATPEGFINRQAMIGSVILRNYDWKKINKRYTYIFEIIHPDKKVFVDYGGSMAIILLAVIDTKTGKELDLEKNYADFPYLKEVPVHNKSIKELKEDQKYNQRGYVLLFKSGLRVSVEFDSYIKGSKKHKIAN